MEWLDILLAPLWIVLLLAAYFAPIGLVIVFSVAYMQALKDHEFALKMIHGLAVIIMLMAAIWLAPYVGSL